MAKHSKKKRTQKKSRIKKSPIQLINIFIIILSVILLGVITNTFLDEDTKTIENKKNDTKIQKIKQTQNKPKNNKDKNNDKIEEKTKALEIEYIEVNSQELSPINAKKNSYKFQYPNKKNDAIKVPDIENIELIEVQKQSNKTITHIEKPKDIIIKKELPKLAIIIDDVSASHQVKKIQNIGYPIIMSFLPPTNRHPNSAKIAKDLNMYMIHLPLEASIRSIEEENTLHIGDSLRHIEQRIKKVKQWYPKAKYINNHTGSKFTEDYQSMDKLFTVLKKYNYIFLDSKTTAKSVTKELAKKHNLQYLTRNIFLDNKHEKSYIQKQLKKAIKIAKRNGYAIAIGHPHKVTLQTLKDSSYLFDGIELVFINKL